MVLAASVAAGETPVGPVRRFALFVGNNEGGEGTRTLLYSRDDATRLHDVLVRLGGVKAEDAMLLLDDSADVVVRLGGKDTRPNEVVAQLEASAAITRRKVTLMHSETSLIPRRQTNAFRPGSAGVKFEVDCHFRFE